MIDCLFFANWRNSKQHSFGNLFHFWELALAHELLAQTSGHHSRRHVPLYGSTWSHSTFVFARCSFRDLKPMPDAKFPTAIFSRRRFEKSFRKL